MKDVKLEIDINRPADEVFDFTLNPANTPSWVSGVVSEEANESPAKLGTIYKNQDKAGNWSEFAVTAFEAGVMFELTKKDGDTHVRYTFKPLDNDRCTLEYCVSVDEGSVAERFSEDNIQNLLKALKQVIEQTL